MRKKTSSTKEQILKMLKVQKRLTVSEMAKQLNITEMAVRRHLNSLERDELVQTTLVRQPLGRPTNVYELTTKGEQRFPRHYQQTMIDFLADLEQMAGKEMVDQLFKNRQERMKRMYEANFLNKSFAEKVKELVDLQNEHGYMTELKKKSDDLFELVEHNCPIAELAQVYPIACECERGLFETLIHEAEIVSKTCLAAGDDACRYDIKRKK
ncbi:helix-turn-helix transcriptional regulator [Thermolongibacillus altinsuensis]|uniref:helix-turn-helix transcriptional regulator n=1 Tax=Thermolongibacillus altinsuensis TaxID=575256 RepID=UPI00242A30E8|nr:metalloregulator ArsR/SmtB family transcription factor [Thermolongibacillus altinsuensis]GMB09025.1 DeoR family transcriptional regulator [Thermolongibacillus altinsuensis]